MEKQLSIEENFEKIESILEQLESKEVSLEESFNLYKEGMECVKHSNDLIDEVEKKVQILNAQGSLEDFEEV